MARLAEEGFEISLACRQIRFKAKFAQGKDVFRKRRSLFFKKMQVVRGCGAKRNVPVYMVYSDRRLIEGSPKNSTSRCRSYHGVRAIRLKSATIFRKNESHHHRNAAVCTRSSHSRVSLSSSCVTVIEHPAISSEVT